MFDLSQLEPTLLYSWIIVGVIVGVILPMIDHQSVRGGIMGTIIASIIGAVLGGLMTPVFFGDEARAVTTTLLPATAGAFIFGFAERLLFRETGHIKTTTPNTKEDTHD
jgi:uncharacterized membrane protein YeaQ/YmgE (transglycosylase-associated protein family)